MKNQIKILRIVNRLNVGGPTYNVAYLSKFLPDYYITKIIAGNRESFEASSEYVLEQMGLEFEFIPSMYRPINILKDFLALISIIKIINRYQPDIIHTHAAKAGALGRCAVFFSRHKPMGVFHTYHGNVFDGYFSKIKSALILFVERLLAKSTTGIISISALQKQELFEKYKITTLDKIHVIPLGFDLSKFQKDSIAKREAFRNEFHIQPSTLIISIIGRLAPIKNHELLIRSFSEAIEKTDVDIKLFIIGDGELKDKLINCARNHKLEVCISPNFDNQKNANVFFLSWRKDIDYVNAGSDIIALSSLNEGTPVSIIEAMASNKAVLTTNVGGVKDFINNGYDGIISSLNFNDYSESLVELINNTCLRNKIAENASKKVMSIFHYKRLVEDIDKLYKSKLK